MLTFSLLEGLQKLPRSTGRWLPDSEGFLTILKSTIYENPFIPPEHHPHPKQMVFLAYLGEEALYGGAAGGGKSDALLLAALQFIELPGYAALLLRRTFPMLSQPESLIPRSKEWLMGKPGVRWDDHYKRWMFPSGSTLTFGHVDHESDVYQYQSAAYHFIGYDELTQFTEFQYTYLHSRNRRLAGQQNIPLRMRAATNPGGVGHDWVKRRFVGPEPLEGTVFVPASLKDNPSLDEEAYVKSLQRVDPVTRAQLLAGNWDAYEGGRFKRDWFKRWRQYTENRNGQIIPVFELEGIDTHWPESEGWRFIIADPAATVLRAPGGDRKKDYTAIGVFGVFPDGNLLVLDMVREYIDIDLIPVRIQELCRKWQPLYVGIEAIGYQWAIINACKRLPGIPAVRGLEPQGKGKLVRATPAIIRAEQGALFLPYRAPWLDEFEAEILQFTGDEKVDSHDDQVDVLAYAVQELDKGGQWQEQPVAQERVRALERLGYGGGRTAGEWQSNAERRGLYGR